MKKVISFVLALVLCFGLCACSNNDTKEDNIEKALVGVWKATVGPYIYIYKDGTCDYYGRAGTSEVLHYNAFIWEIEGDYIVMKHDIAGSSRIEKYTLSGETLLDKQGKVYATKLSSDTSVDIQIG